MMEGARSSGRSRLTSWTSTTTCRSSSVDYEKRSIRTACLLTLDAKSCYCMAAKKYCP